MFFCDPCRDKNNWPDSIGRSYGRCEVCGDKGSCNNVPSRFLPPPPPDRWEILDNYTGEVIHFVDVPRGKSLDISTGFTAYNPRTKEARQGVADVWGRVVG